MRRRNSEANISTRSGSHSSASCSCSDARTSCGRPPRVVIPPGALGSYAQAQRCIRSCGLSLAALDLGSVPRTTAMPLFPCKTIAALFSHRKLRLKLQAHCTSFKRKLAEQKDLPELPEQAKSGLLQLPDDILVKIICNLKHQETSPLAKVCIDMRGAVNEAIRHHFSYSTPHREGGEIPAARPAKRQKMQTGPPSAPCSSTAFFASRRKRSSTSNAPRALRFQDSQIKSKLSQGQVDSKKVAQAECQGVPSEPT